MLYAGQGQYEAAHRALSKAIELQPNYATAHENLGDVYVRLATLAYDEAFRLNSDNDRARQKWEQLAAFLHTQSTLNEKSSESTPSGSAAGVPKRSCYTVGDLPKETDQSQVMAWAQDRGMTAEKRVVTHTPCSS